LIETNEALKMSASLKTRQLAYPGHVIIEWRKLENGEIQRRVLNADDKNPHLSSSDWKKVRQSELEFQIGFNHDLKVWLREIGWAPRRAVNDTGQ
jgi:hypothetical protein